MPGLLAAGGLLFGATAAAQVAAPAAGAGEASSGPGWFELFRNVRFELGPVLWRGDLTTEFRSLRLPDRPARSSFQESANLSVASYIYQPWFVRVSGNLGFVWSNGSDAAEGRATALTGGGVLSVFPASRFPLEASFSVSDSRSSEDLAGGDFRTVRAGLRQSYRTESEVQVSARMDRSVVSSPTLGRDVLNVAAANLSWRGGAHNVSGEGFVSENTGGVSGTETRIRRLNAQHGYVPADNLSVESMATYNWQESAQRSGSAYDALAGRFVQLASYATWRPEEDEPLYDAKHPMLFTGGVRLTALGFERSGASSDTIGLSGSAGFTYEVDPLTRLGASASVTQTSSPGAQGGLFTAFSASANYDPRPIRWRGADYSWRLSGGANGATGGGQDRLSAFAQANHQISRNVTLGESSLLTFTFGQGVGANASNRDLRGFSLSHSAQASWSLAGDSVTQTYVSLSGADARSIGTPDTEFQLVNLQLTRQAPLDKLSFWTANITVQGARQRGDPGAGASVADRPASFTVSTFGNLSYHQRRLFGVPRLQLVASYTANQSQLQSRATGDLNAPPRVTGDTLEVRLEHRIGKLDSRLALRSTSIDGRRNAGVFLRVTRYF